MLTRKTHEQLETIAETFLKAHGKFDGFSLHVELTIEAYGYYIWPKPGLGQVAEGFIPRKPGFIFVDEEQAIEQPLRYRFTLAEELAHVLIHVPALKGKSVEELERTNGLIRAAQYRLYEHDAKYLASCLLMPRSKFVDRFRTHFSAQSKRVSNRSKILRYTSRQLGRDFCVPPAAAGQRAFKLKLIDEADLFELGF